MPRTLGSKNGTRSPSVTIWARVPPAERAAFEAAALARGLKLTEWIRTVLRREAGLWIGSTEPEPAQEPRES